MRFGRQRSIGRDVFDSLDPVQQAQYKEGGGRVRSRPGADVAPQDMGSLGRGVAQNPQGGLSKESNWRAFFGPKQEIDPVTRRAFRPIEPPVVDNNPMANPVADVPPNPNQAENIDQTGDYWWMNPAGQPQQDLTTPEALMADATNESVQYFNKRKQRIPAPAPGQVQSGTSLLSKYGSASVNFGGDWST